MNLISTSIESLVSGIVIFGAETLCITDKMPEKF